MFGTVARMKVQPGKEQEFADLGRRWSQERGAATGEVASYIFKLEGQPNEYIVVAVFSDRETYFQNANDPETDRWYRQVRSLLETDPQWNDGEILDAPVVSGL